MIWECAVCKKLIFAADNGSPVSQYWHGGVFHVRGTEVIWESFGDALCGATCSLEYHDRKGEKPHV